MGSGHTVNPNGGVLFRRGLEKPTQVIITRLRPGDLDETPRADPHAGWCGGWGRPPPATRLSLVFQYVDQIYSLSTKRIPSSILAINLLDNVCILSVRNDLSTVIS